jgi:hypothetical protein
MNNEVMKTELDILKIISSEYFGGSWARILCCPECGHDFSHTEPPYHQVGEEYKMFSGRGGELSITPLWSECGSKWQVCIGFHKGQAPIFVRMIKSCKKK